MPIPRGIFSICTIQEDLLNATKFPGVRNSEVILLIRIIVERIAK